VRKAYEAYEFHLAFQSLHNFCAVDLSALYLDVLKDRLYTSAANAPGGGPPRPRATGSSTRSSA
jgi:isoleucyl-tRNA synthetase